MGILAPVIFINEYGLTWSLLMYPVQMAVIYFLVGPMFHIKKVTMHADGLHIRGIVGATKIKFRDIASADYYVGRGFALVLLDISKAPLVPTQVVFMPTMGVDPAKNAGLMEFQQNTKLSLTKVSPWSMKWCVLGRGRG